MKRSNKGTKWDNIAYKEYYATKGKSAFNFSHDAWTRKINQYVIEHRFSDGSKLHVSSCKCRVNLNYMLCFNTAGEQQAQRILF